MTTVVDQLQWIAQGCDQCATNHPGAWEGESRAWRATAAMVRKAMRDLANQQQAVADGWAVFEDGAISVASVSPTRRAAMVNFLITDRGLVVANGVNDADIERAWALRRGEAVLVPVKIMGAE